MPPVAWCPPRDALTMLMNARRRGVVTHLPETQRMSATPAALRSTPWAPLRHPVFRALWIAALASNFGASMHEVGEGWLMTTLSPSPLSVALLQAAESLAIFLLAIPAGALADVVDRRRLSIATQGWLLVGATALGALAITHRMTPPILIVLTFAMGIGVALDAPLWQALVAETVSREELPRAVMLGGLSMNLARAFAPGLGGFLVAAAGPPAVFFLNAATFAIVIIVLMRWRRVQAPSVAPPERWLGAIQSGLRYTRHSPQVLAAFVRAAATVFGPVCLLALLPSFARGTLGLDSFGYGVLLGCMGIGAVGAAAILPAFEENLSADATLSVGTMLLACALGGLSFAPSLASAAPTMLVVGFAWMSVISSVNVAVQTATPSWVRARVSSVFMVVFQSALLSGAIVWGLIAARTTVRTALLCSAFATLASAALRFRFALVRQMPDFSPVAWPEPKLVCAPPEDAGPVLVSIGYRVAAENVSAFAAAMRTLARIRRREGAYYWGLYRDASSADLYQEVFLVDSWAEHLRQHARVSAEERTAEDRVRELTEKGEPNVRHLIAVTDE
jgi:MFS family permease